MQDSRSTGSVNTAKRTHKEKREPRTAANLHRLTEESDLLESVQILKSTSRRIHREKKELSAAANLHRRRIASYQKELDELNKEEQFLSVTGAFGVRFCTRYGTTNAIDSQQTRSCTYSFLPFVESVVSPYLSLH